MISDNLPQLISDYLLTRADWVPVEEICTRFGINERLLRAHGRRPSLISGFAISSSTRGIKHIHHTTVNERLHYKHSRIKRLIAERRALKEHDLAVARCLTRNPVLMEKPTHQLVML